MTNDLNRQNERTIADFGEQWSRYTRNDGFYASQEMFADIVGPLLSAEALRHSCCAEVGAGTGRVAQMMLRAGAAHVVAIEPSRASEVLEQNLAPYGDRVTVVRETGDRFKLDNLDYILAIGVLHHIPDPKPTVDRMYASLKDGGQALVWLYGREGNTLYLAVAEPLRWVTRRLPVRFNTALAALLYLPLIGYVSLCRWLPLPMRGYMRRVLAPMRGKDLRLVIVDQLNPTWAKYYSGAEARQLLQRSGFVGVTLYHRHGYSWTVRGTKKSPHTVAGC